MRLRQVKGGFGVAVVALMLASGCGGSSVAQPATTASPMTTLPSADPATSPTPPFTAAEAREAANPDPSFDYGFAVQATTDGFHPRWLVSVCCRPIVWRNRTTAAVTVVFDHLGVTSGPIAPGGTWLFVPKNVQSITYHAGSDASIHGVIQVNQPFES